MVIFSRESLKKPAATSIALLLVLRLQLLEPMLRPRCFLKKTGGGKLGREKWEQQPKNEENKENILDDLKNNNNLQFEG